MTGPVVSKVARVSLALLLGAISLCRHADAACPPTMPGAAAPSAAQVYDADMLYLPTPQRVVEAMLRMARVTGADVVYDLGSGDGRIPIAAARKHGARAVGIELDARMIASARCNAREAGMERLVEFRQEDLFAADLREATVVTLFLFPEMTRRLSRKLYLELRPGTRIVSHRFDLGDWPPLRTAVVDGHEILLWIVPPRTPGRAPPEAPDPARRR